MDGSAAPGGAAPYMNVHIGRYRAAAAALRRRMHHQHQADADEQKHAYSYAYFIDDDIDRVIWLLLFIVCFVLLSTAIRTSAADEVNFLAYD